MTIQGEMRDKLTLMINYEEMQNGAIVGELVRSPNPIVAGARADDKSSLIIRRSPLL